MTGAGTISPGAVRGRGVVSTTTSGAGSATMRSARSGRSCTQKGAGKGRSSSTPDAAGAGAVGSGARAVTGAGASRSILCHGIAHGQATSGGVTSLIRTTSQSACRTVGPSGRSRLATIATSASTPATTVVSANHPNIGVSPLYVDRDCVRSPRSALVVSLRFRFDHRR